MIVGIGIDAVRIDRLREWESKPNVLHRFFHPQELEQILKRGKGSLQSLAARFAAKEAFGKALGTGLKGISLREIRIDTDDLGKPHMVVYGKAKKMLDALRGKHLFVSLTHETEHAIAVVVIEGE